ncbi:MAG: beta-galactosidase, partial [Planctomycetota bacterium]
QNPDGRDLTIGWRVRREDGVVIPLKTTKSRDAEGSLSEKLPRLRVGRYRLDAIVRDGRTVMAWETVPFEAKTWARCGAVKLACASGWGDVGGRIRGNVSVTAPLLEGERVEARLLDRRGRVLLRRTLADGGAFEFPIAPWLPMLVRVEAARCDDQGDLTVAHQWFHVVKRHRGQFNFLIWDVPRGPTAPYAEESLARLGTTVQLKGGTPPRYVAAHDIAWVPYTTRILEKHTDQGLMRPHCWNDAAKVKAHVEALAEKYRGARQHGVFVYSLGDENHVRGSCLSPHCLKAYRDYLKKAYGSIAQLNASWGSDYESFADVQLLKPDDNLGHEAKRQGHYPRWYDRQAFRSWNYVQYCKAHARAYRAIDPRSRTGFEGAGRFGRGDDLDLFVRELDFWSPYPGTADEVLRSIAPRDFPRANWMGYRKDATSLIAKYWRMVTRGCDSVWWWRWDCIGRFHGFLAPHLGPWPATRELVEETQIVRDGLGDLLLRCEMLDGGIAMLFSHPSLYANKVEGSTSYGSVEQNHRAWHRAIRDLGLQFRYVTDRQLRLGEFEPGRYQVLILSQCEAIGAKEAEVIRRFVERGGSLAADVRPGLYDRHCKPRKTGVLDHLFGIRRAGRGEARKADVTLEMRERSVTVKGARCDPGVELTDGQAGAQADGLPLMITNEPGAGRTLLLNFAMASYPRIDQSDTPEAAAELLLSLAFDAGLWPTIRTVSDGRRTRNLETVRWRNGALEIVALFRHTGEDEAVRVELNQPRHVRDLRVGRSFEAVRAFPTKILGSRPTWLVLSPKPLAAVTAKLAKPTVKRGTQPTLRLQVPGAQGLHAIRLRATTPEGKAAEWLHQVVIVGAEPVEVPLPIARNDPQGRWTLRVIDLFTDIGPELTLAVE